MRLSIKTTPNTSPVRFDYQQNLVGTLHKWIGRDNDLHGKMSLYSFSWLQKGKMQGNQLIFPKGAEFFMSFYDEAVIKDVVRSIRDSPDMFCGMEVLEVSIVSAPDLTDRDLFYLGSPVFLHYREEDNYYRQYTYADSVSSKLMTDILKRKMQMAGLPEDKDLSVKFDLTYNGKRTKLMTYRGIKNKASMCPIIIEGDNRSKQFAWNVGIGNSTGIGFGAIY